MTDKGSITYNKTGVRNTSVAVLFAGVFLLQGLNTKNIIAECNYENPSYIQCKNLNQEMGFSGLDNKVIDLMKIENLNKIDKISGFKEDWNGNGGKAFQKNTIIFLKEIINTLDKQPQIAPTGRNSLLMQYELDDKSLLAFEVNEKRAEKVYVPKGDYAKAEVDIYTENIGKKMKESVAHFYGFK